METENRADVLAEINRVLTRMPYLPNVHWGGDVESTEELVGVLGDFADWLRQHAAEVDAQTTELWELKRDVAAVRRLFGTDPKGGE